MRTNFQGSERKRLVFRAVLAIFIALPVFLSTVAGTNAAAAGQWSFEDHPQPGFEQYTAKERILLDPYVLKAKGYDGCEGDMRAKFDIYLGRYPEYARTGKPEELFRNWRIAVATGTQPNYDACIILYPYLKILDDSESYPFVMSVYCGASTSIFDNEKEKRLFRLLDELADYTDRANNGGHLGASSLLRLNHFPEFIDFNPGIEYYLRKFLGTDKLYVDLADTSHLEPLLSAERKAFILKAVKDGNFQAVIDTTRPCKPMKKPQRDDTDPGSETIPNSSIRI